jgi:hypothetical protein
MRRLEKNFRSGKIFQRRQQAACVSRMRERNFMNG